MLHALLLYVLVAQPGPAELVEQLGHDSARKRQQAFQELERLGLEAKEAVTAGARSHDREIAAACQSLLDRIARLEVERNLEREQRSRALLLVTLEAKETRLAEVFQRITEQLGLDFALPEAEEERLVSASFDRAPLAQVLDSLGLAFKNAPDGLTLWTRRVKTPLVARRPPSGPVYVPGGRFVFESWQWNPDGNPRGLVLRSELQPVLRGEIEWKPDHARTESTRSLEYCPRNSPKKVFLPDPKADTARLVLKGLRRWYCKSPLQIHDPRNGPVVECGEYRFELQWPNLILHCPRKQTQDVLYKALQPRWIKLKLKPGLPEPGGGRRLLVARGGGGMGGMSGPLLWCGCRGSKHGKPAHVEPPPEPPTDRYTVEIPGARRYALKDVASIEIVFRRPVEEPFEVVSPELGTATLGKGFEEALNLLLTGVNATVGLGEIAEFGRAAVPRLQAEWSEQPDPEKKNRIRQAIRALKGLRLSLLGELSGHGIPAFGVDGTRLYTSQGRVIEVWQIEPLKKVKEVEVEDIPIALCETRSGLAYSVRGGEEVVLLDRKTWERTGEIPGAASGLTMLDKGSEMAVVGPEGEVRFVNMADRKEKGRLGTGKGVRSVVAPWTGDFFYALFANRLELWNRSKNELVYGWDFRGPQACALPDGSARARLSPSSAHMNLRGEGIAVPFRNRPAGPMTFMDNGETLALTDREGRLFGFWVEGWMLVYGTVELPEGGGKPLVRGFGPNGKWAVVDVGPKRYLYKLGWVEP